MSIDRTARLSTDSLRVTGINPRAIADPASQADLEASVRQHGILVPLLVRPIQEADGGHYEVIAGSRRLAAAQAIGLIDVPVIVRACDDDEARTLALVDNLQREDVHPIEEARGYADLLDLACTVEVLAAKVGRHPSYIRRRLRLRQLVPPVAEACRTGEITIAHAEELAGLAPDVQPRALTEGCFVEVMDWESQDDVGLPGRARQLRPLRELREWIRQHTKIDITQPETIALFPQLAEAQAAAEALLEVSTATMTRDVPAGVLPATKWRAADAKRDQCEHRQRAVVVHTGHGWHRGDGLGEIRWVCAHRKCATHFPPKPTRPAGAASSRELSWKEQEAQRKRDQAAYDTLHEAAVVALAEKTQGFHLYDRALVDLLAKTTAHDDMQRIAALVGGAITLKTFGQALVLAEAMEASWPGAKPDLARLCKRHGVNLEKIERQLAKATAAASPDQPAKKTKKPSRRST